MKEFLRYLRKDAGDLDIVRVCDDRQWGFKDGQDCREPQDQDIIQPVSYIESGPMTLGPGQILPGTGWKVKQFSELWSDLEFEPPPWMLNCL